VNSSNSYGFIMDISLERSPLFLHLLPSVRFHYASLQVATCSLPVGRQQCSSNTTLNIQYIKDVKYLIAVFGIQGYQHSSSVRRSV